jgi:hypothetical protein
MTSQELRTWLMTDASGEDAFAADPDMHVSELGRDVVRILGKRKLDLTERDAETMREVVEFVAVRLGSPPPEEADDEWRRSLMTVGHDPLKPA